MLPLDTILYVGFSIVLKLIQEASVSTCRLLKGFERSRPLPMSPRFDSRLNTILCALSLLVLCSKGFSLGTVLNEVIIIILFCLKALSKRNCQLFIQRKDNFCFIDIFSPC